MDYGKDIKKNQNSFFDSYDYGLIGIMIFAVIGLFFVLGCESTDAIRRAKNGYVEQSECVALAQEIEDKFYKVGMCEVFKDTCMADAAFMQTELSRRNCFVRTKDKVVFGSKFGHRSVEVFDGSKWHEFFRYNWCNGKRGMV